MPRPLNTTVNPKANVTIVVSSKLKQQLVDFAYEERSSLTAVLIEALEDFLAKNAHILSERHIRKQEQVEMLLREERERQRAERGRACESAEFETKFGAAQEVQDGDDAP